MGHRAHARIQHWSCHRCRGTLAAPALSAAQAQPAAGASHPAFCSTLPARVPCLGR